MWMYTVYVYERLYRRDFGVRRVQCCTVLVNNTSFLTDFKENFDYPIQKATVYYRKIICPK